MAASLVALLSLWFPQVPAQDPTANTDEFIRVARGLEHLSHYVWARECAALEAAAAALSTAALTELLEHSEPRVRAAAIVGLYFGGHTAALPRIVELVEDQGQAPPRRSSLHVAVPIGELESDRADAPRFSESPQSVGDIAREIVTAHLGAAGSRYRLDPRQSQIGFAEYWRERGDREHCLSWMTLALWRASFGASPVGPEARPRIEALRRKIDALDAPYRDWLLLALATPWDGGDSPTGAETLAPFEDLVAAGRSIGEQALIEFLAGQSPAVSDPDMQLGPDSCFPYERVACFVLRHATELVPNATVEFLSSLEQHHMAREPVGLAPELNTSLWSVAAADLHPDRACAILHDAFVRHGAGHSNDDQDRRAHVAIALWRHCGEEALELIVDWFFSEAPVDGGGFGRHRLAWFCATETSRNLLRAIALDERVAALDWYSFFLLAHATNEALGREVVRTSNLQRSVSPVAREHVEQLQRAWSPPTTPGLTHQRSPKPLAEGARVEDWPTFLGPRRDGISVEAPLDIELGGGAPPLVWSLERGEGLASPAIGEGRLVFTHRLDGRVHIDCHDPETGERFWRHSFPCKYAGRYYDNGGPRATPAIAGGRVIVHGAGGLLVCLDLATGEPIWQVDTAVEMKVGDDYFGVVSSPLVVGEFVIQNVGAPGGPSVAAFDLATGKLRWGAGEKWGPSCASPVLARFGGKERILVVAGGESDPPTGGLMVISPAGELTCEVPFRSRTTLSVNGASPVAVDGGVYLTAAYNVGSAVVDIDAEGRGQERWRKRSGLALEFSTPVHVGGLIVAIDGVAGRVGAIVAVDPLTGEERARRTLEFEQVIGKDQNARALAVSVGKGSLIQADGVFWVLGDTGQLLTMRLTEEGFELVARASLFYARETWTPLVLSRGLLYVCQNYPEPAGGAPARLLCYDVRGKN